MNNISFNEIKCLNDFDKIIFNKYNNVFILLSNSEIKKKIILNLFEYSYTSTHNIIFIYLDLAQITKNLLFNNDKKYLEINKKNKKKIFNLYIKQIEQPINNETYGCCINRINLFFNIIKYTNFMKKLIELYKKNILISIVSIENGLFTNSYNIFRANRYKQWYDKCIIAISDIYQKIVFPNLFTNNKKNIIKFKDKLIYIPKELSYEYFKYYNRTYITFGSFLYNKANNTSYNIDIIYYVYNNNIKYYKFILNKNISHNNWMKTSTNICRTNQIIFKINII